MKPFIIFGIPTAVYYIGKYYFKIREKRRVHTFLLENPNKCLSYLKKDFYYYKLLTSEEQREFCKRFYYFYTKLEFEAINDLVFKEEMRTKFSALCTQITFGFKDYKLESLKKVLLFPKYYYSKYFKSNVLGLTLSNGHTYLSWEGVKYGIEKPNDKLNLGLHELAHSIDIESTDFDTSWNMDDWYDVAIEEYQNVVHNDPLNLIRDYANVNLYELWAVSVEYFFERPLEFREHFPRLYHITKKTLNQDIPERGNK